jgi:transcriptional regulator with PAS, ATPase and Fis domain
MEDMPLLIEHFITKLNRIRGKSIKAIDQQALDILMSHNFPGNIRELENIIEHAFVLCSEGDIRVRHLPGTLSRQSLSAAEYETLDDPVKCAEVKVIMDALKKNNFNRKAAAKDLGIHKSTLFRKIEKLGINLPKIDGRSKNKQNDI